MVEGCLFVDVQIVEYANLILDDTVMFTYSGTGQFDIVVFDTERLEKTQSDYVNPFGKIS